MLACSVNNCGNLQLCEVTPSPAPKGSDALTGIECLHPLDQCLRVWGGSAGKKAGGGDRRDEQAVFGVQDEEQVRRDGQSSHRGQG